MPIDEKINEKIFIMADKICSDKNLIAGLIKLSSFKEAYIYCTGISGGYTEQEFYDWLEKFFYDGSSDAKESSERYLKADELDKISAGTGNIKKLSAASLAALTLSTSVISTRISAAETVMNSPASLSINSEESAVEQKLSFWQRCKSYVIGIGVTAAVIITSWMAYNHFQNKDKYVYEHELRRDPKWKDKNSWEKFKSYIPGYVSDESTVAYEKVKQDYELLKNKGYSRPFKYFQNEVNGYIESVGKQDNSKTTENLIEEFVNRKKSIFEEISGKNFSNIDDITKLEGNTGTLAERLRNTLGKDGIGKDGSGIREEDIKKLGDFRKILGSNEIGDLNDAIANFETSARKSDGKGWSRTIVEDAIKSIPYVGGAYIGLTGLMDCFGDLGRNVKRAGELGSSVRDLAREAAKRVNSFVNSLIDNKISPEQAMNTFDRCVAPEIIGQEEAKEKISKHCAIIAQRYDKYDKDVKNAIARGEDPSKVEKPGSPVNWYAGPSGVGKTKMIWEIVKNNVFTSPDVSLDQKFMIIGPQRVREGSRESIIDQIFGGPDWQERVNGGNKVRQSLADFIGDAKIRQVLLIDDIHRMCRSEKDNRQIDDTLAGLTTGEVRIDGKTIDTSNLIVFITSNETNEFFPTPHKSSVYGINHEQSRMNRFNLVEFKNLLDTDYEIIARKHIRSDVTDYWENHTVYDKNLGKDIPLPVNIEIKDEVYKKIAVCMREVDNGARTLGSFIGDLTVSILYRVTAKNGDYYFNNKKIYIDASIAKGEIGEDGRLQPKLNVVTWLEGEERPVVPEDVPVETFAPPKTPPVTVDKIKKRRKPVKVSGWEEDYDDD